MVRHNLLNIAKGPTNKEPSGHCVMCEWCAAQSIPSHKADKTRPAKPSNCPLCRKRVKQKVCCFTLLVIYADEICRLPSTAHENAKENNWVQLLSSSALKCFTPQGTVTQTCISQNEIVPEPTLFAYQRIAKTADLRPQMRTAYLIVQTIPEPAEQHP